MFTIHPLTRKSVGTAVGTTVLSAAALFSQTALADAITDAITSGKANADIRIRYEDVESGDLDSDGMTIRTRLGYTTGTLNGFSAMVEFEDTRDMLGIDDEENLIPDNENTEVDQAFFQYKNDMLTGKVGRQVITLDNHRFVGHVGWRQDRQTFDAARTVFTPIKGLTVDLSYLWKVNRINSGTGGFADVEDTSHKIINIAYDTPVGKLTVYGYDLSEEGNFDATETYGVRFTGKTGGDVAFLYTAEFADQDNETEDASTEYQFLELGVVISGVTGKVGYEVLGSDDGDVNFETPLATVHAFNGWADVFLGGSLFGNIDGGNGLEDMYVSVGGSVAGLNLTGVYHDFESDEGGSDLGSEYDLLLTKKFTPNYSGGIKYAAYSAEDAGGNGGEDKDILWVWVGATY